MAPLRLFPLAGLCLAALGTIATAAEAPEFAAIFRLLDEHCIECHAKEDPDGGLVLEDHAALLKGGESGASVLPGKGHESLLVKYLRGEVERDGKRRFMPPGKRDKLSAEEIAQVIAWIDAGAKPGAAAEKPRELNVPKITPRVEPRRAIHSLAYEPKAKLLAVGRFGRVELLSAETRQPVRTLTGLKGNVNELVFSADGQQLFAASGENSLFGEVKQWRVADGMPVRTFQGHRDTIYALALSPDGKTLATGSYDQQIKLWSTESGTEQRTLRGHNGGVFALAFRPDGRVLASASADRTVKLWDVATGQRRDTLSQPQKEQVALAWSADGQRLAAGGFDNRLRVWTVTPEAKETSNPLQFARFAHEGALARVVWSADGAQLLTCAQDGTVKIWDAGTVRERLLLEKQPDWPAALAFAGGTVVVGRLDGTLAFYDAKTGNAVPPPAPPKPPEPATVTAFQPRGVKRGDEVKIQLLGKGLAGLKSVQASDARVQLTLLPGGHATEAWLAVKSPGDLPRGSYAFTITGANGKPNAPLTLSVDDLPQIAESDEHRLETLPGSAWGTLTAPGEADLWRFTARAGETLVFDLASKSLGSKADATLTLQDASGKVLASSNDFDGTGDPLLAHTFTQAGEYVLRVGDLQFGGSAEHFYRLSAGALPFVTACFPLSVQAGKETPVQLIGHNLPPGATVLVQATTAGEVQLPLDAQRFRARRGFKLLATDLPHAREAEPNDVLAQATPVAAPATVSGSFIGNSEKGDTDLYHFTARKGSRWIIETTAAQRGSPADTKIEVLDAQGKPIERLLLQAVRDSAITFRPIDSNTNDARVENWREMELNQWLYMAGEVAKIFRMPEGPDSGFQFYAAGGKRVAYFDTTATAHPLDEPCYIVEAHAPGTKLISTGLPIFPLVYQNDDDGRRRNGADSRVEFTAPADGDYLVRVQDSRGLGGPEYVYDLSIREPRPGYSVNLSGLSGTVPAGSGQSFTVTALRDDGFEGDVRVEISGAPAEWKIASPLIVQAGHTTARGTIHALAGAKPLSAEQASAIRITATAEVEGKTVTMDGGAFPALKVGPAPELIVALEPAAPGDTLERVTLATRLQPQNPTQPLEITIAPGETIPAWVKIRRDGGKPAALRFDVENLPHGCIVDNLGLNGITLLEEQTEGEIHLKCDGWVAEMDRLVFAQIRGAGAQTSLPVLLHVRKKAGGAVTAR